MKQIILDNYKFESTIKCVDKFEEQLKPFFETNFECLFNCILGHSINDLENKLSDSLHDQIDGDYIFNKLTDHQKIDLTRYYEDYEKLDYKTIDKYLDGMSYYALNMNLRQMINNFCNQLSNQIDELDLNIETLTDTLDNNDFEIKIHGFNLYINQLDLNLDD